MTECALGGRTCTVITRRTNPEYKHEDVINSKTRLYRLDIGPKGPMDKRRLNEFHDHSLREAKRIINEYYVRPHLLHSVYWNSGRLALDLSLDMQLPYVHTVISNGIRRQLEGAHDQPAEREHIERKVFSNAWAIFSISQEEKIDLVKHYDVDPAKIHLVGRPVQSCFLQPAHDESGQPRPLSLGVR